MIIRERLIDNYDPPLPWIVEADTDSEMLNDTVGKDEWCRTNVNGQMMVAGRRVAFAEYQDALMFYLRFK